MSFHKRRIVYSDVSSEEIVDILLYTEQEWGPLQRSIYRDLILDTVGRLAGMPSLGRPRPEISRGLRSYRLGSHLVYYWHDDERLIVAHILHSRQDARSVGWESQVNEPEETS